MQYIIKISLAYFNIVPIYFVRGLYPILWNISNLVSKKNQPGLTTNIFPAQNFISKKNVVILASITH